MRSLGGSIVTGTWVICKCQWLRTPDWAWLKYSDEPCLTCPRDRFVPRHEDELELEVDDPLLVELQAEDYWYEAYNMRTGARGVFPAYYAIEVTKEPEHMAGSALPQSGLPTPASAHQLTTGLS